MIRALALAAAVVAGALPADPRWQEANGDMRMLVIRATWGPHPAAAEDFSGVAALYRRASFGRFRLKLDVTPWLDAYSAPLCPEFGRSGSVSVYGPVGDRAQAAAVAAGYDPRSYGRLVYILPERVCNITGRGIGREVFVPQADGIEDRGLVHELGHTFGLPHANSSTCARGCRIVEYGDPLSPMGHGGDDFTALEKLKLGWITSVRTVDDSGIYSVADIDGPSSDPQALVVPTAAGEYWIEHRAAKPEEIIVRLVKPNEVLHPVYLRSIFLARAEVRYRASGVFSVTPQFQFRWLDRKRPTRPRARALDHAVLSWSRSTDAGSGVAAYRVTIDGKLFTTTTQLNVALPFLAEGGHRLTVVAFDRAGNRSRPGVVNLRI